MSSAEAAAPAPPPEPEPPEPEPPAEAAAPPQPQPEQEPQAAASAAAEIPVTATATMAELPPTPTPTQPQQPQAGGTNIFTQKPYPSTFSNLEYNKTITIDSTELPYFAVRSFKDKRADPLSGPDFAELFKDIEDEGWAKIEITDNSPQMEKDEIDFLESLGLALHKGDTEYYITKFAYLLYDKQDGLFIRYNNQWSPEDKKAELTAFMRLALTYILPGHWWRAFYARQYLPGMIGHGAMLNEKLLQIEHQWNKIAAQCDMPQS